MSTSIRNGYSSGTLTSRQSHWHPNPLTSAASALPAPDPDLDKAPTPPLASLPNAQHLPVFRTPAAKPLPAERRGIRIGIHLNNAVCTADGIVEGWVEIECRRRKGVKIGGIAVEIVGFEETTTKPPTKLPPRRLLLWTTYSLQDTTLAPTAAVHAGPTDEHGMWTARQGRTVLPFRVPLGPRVGDHYHCNRDGEEDVVVVRERVEGMLPSAFWSRGVGGVRYVVCGLVYTKHGRTPSPLPLFAHRDLELLESAPPPPPLLSPSDTHTAPVHTGQVAATVPGRWLGLGKKGDVVLRAKLQGDGDAWVAGGMGAVSVEVVNGSRRK
ncbi:hypothetical protein BDK51DRAFT_25476, partial [Blyttiomyces helicus]